jgi:hypothetical protein
MGWTAGIQFPAVKELFLLDTKFILAMGTIQSPM